MTENQSSKGIFFGWWVVLTAITGMALSVAPIAILSLGLFMKPLSAEFGWDRGDISLAITLAALSLSLSMPIAGRMVDRFGPRHVLYPSILLLGVVVASLYFLTDSILHLYLCFIGIGIAGSGTGGVAYAKVVTNWFNRRRGLALGMTMAGVGLGNAIVSPYSQFLIEQAGWRLAYVGLAATMIVITIPLVWLVLKESPEQMGMQIDGNLDTATDNNKQQIQVYGLTADEARGSRTFWIMLIAFVGIGLGVNGLGIHLVPMLTDWGMTAASAALVYSVSGICTIIGRVSAGYFADRFFAPYVAMFFWACAICAILLLIIGVTGPAAILIGVMIGLGSGGNPNIIAYLISRYFGTRSYGELYGLIYGIHIIGSGLSPLGLGVGFDMMGSYTAVLIIYGSFIALAICMLFFLKAYPNWDQQNNLGG
jgi:MFS family permease